MATVTISQGKLKGGVAVSENGCKYYEFLSIPYAKPPVGDLRFRSPQPPQPWDGERGATKSVVENISSQKDFKSGQIIGSEDCLYLNVLSPKLPSVGSKLLPVMVYIHSGGFISGQGILKEELNFELFLENDVVVVSINYRLGVLGFLSLDIPEVSGNMGLKDQLKALQWVQENIGKFSGDNNNITIFGVSAGSASVEYLLLNSKAKGLFHKAILQSGSTLNDWALNFEYKQLTLNLADKLGYKGDKQDSRALCDFFMNVPAAELTDAGFNVTETFTAKSIYFGFVPTIEKDSEDAFLTTHPYKIIKEGKFTRVPIIRGFCSDEGLLISMMKPSAVNGLMSQKSFIDFWSYELDNGDKEKFENKFRNAYVAIPGDESDHFAVEFFGDLHFSAGVWLASELFAKHDIEQYVYKFSYDGKLNFFKNFVGLKKKGASHGDDQGYMYKDMRVPMQPDEDDKLFRSKIIKMWTNFAKTSNPTPSGDSDIPVKWPKHTKAFKALLDLNKKFTVENNYEPQKMAIFEEIYAKYEK